MRKEWKEAYKKQSELIKAEKQAVRLMSRGGYSAVRALQSVLSYDRVTARLMMEELDDIKSLGAISKTIYNSQPGRNFFLR